MFFSDLLLLPLTVNVLTQGYSTFMCLPPLPENRGTAEATDLRVDSDGYGTSVASVVSSNDGDTEETEEIATDLGQKCRRNEGAKSADLEIAGMSKQTAVIEDSGSSSPVAPTPTKVVPLHNPLPPPSKKPRVASDGWDPDNLVDLLGS